MNRRNFLKSAAATGVAASLLSPAQMPPSLNITGRNTIGDQAQRFPTVCTRAHSHSTDPALLFPTAMSR